MHGLRYAKVSGYSPLHIVGDSVMVLSQLRTHHPSQKSSLVPLFWEARALADDLEVSSWGHHYRTYNKMADRLADIAMDTAASIQVDSCTEHRVVLEATTFICNNVNHWLEASQAGPRVDSEKPNSLTARISAKALGCPRTSTT